MSQSNDENVFSDDDLLTVNVQFPDQKFKISLTVVKAADKRKVFDDFATTFECEGFNKFDIQSQIEELYENRYYEKSQFYGHDLKTTAYKYELVYTDESCQDLKMFTKHEENNKQITDELLQTIANNEDGGLENYELLVMVELSKRANNNSSDEEEEEEEQSYSGSDEGSDAGSSEEESDEEEVEITVLNTGVRKDNNALKANSTLPIRVPFYVSRTITEKEFIGLCLLGFDLSYINQILYVKRSNASSKVVEPINFTQIQLLLQTENKLTLAWAEPGPEHIKNIKFTTDTNFDAIYDEKRLNQEHIKAINSNYFKESNQKVSLTNQILSKLKQKHKTPTDTLFHGFDMQHFTVYRNFIMSLNLRELQMIITQMESTTWNFGTFVFNNVEPPETGKFKPDSNNNQIPLNLSSNDNNNTTDEENGRKRLFGALMDHQRQRIYDEMDNKRQRIEKKFSRITYFDQIQTLVKKKNEALEGLIKIKQLYSQEELIDQRNSILYIYDNEIKRLLALHNENNKVEKPSGSSNDRFMMPSDSTINLLNSDSSSSDNKCDDCGAINFQECTCPDKICNNCSGSVCNCK